MLLIVTGINAVEHGLPFPFTVLGFSGYVEEMHIQVILNPKPYIGRAWNFSQLFFRGRSKDPERQISHPPIQIGSSAETFHRQDPCKQFSKRRVPILGPHHFWHGMVFNLSSRIISENLRKTMEVVSW